MGIGFFGGAAWIARLVFLILLVQAVIEGKRRVAVAAVALGLIGWLLVPRVNPQLVTPCFAIIDIGLVFAVLGRDIRLN